MSLLRFLASPKRNYLPFGESATTTGSFAYTGLRIDPETNGLYYARARMYSPTTLGRFLQPDPIGYADGANLYAYVGNDPLNLVDPFGLAAESGGFGSVMGQFGSAVAGTASALADRVMAGETRNDLVAIWNKLNEPAPGCENCITGMPPILGGSAASAARSAVAILEREGSIIIASIRGTAGEGRVITEMVRQGDTLILRGTHIEGSATLREALNAAAQFGREQGVKRVVVEGGRRTTGANPGHVPKPIIIQTGL